MTMCAKAFWILCFGMMLTLSCTPTVSEKTAEPAQPETPKEKPMRSTDPCAKFSDSKLGDQALDNYVVYRDFLKYEDWDEAFRNWKKVYDVAPAADGRRKTVYEDGIKLYHHKYETASDPSRQQAYIDTVMALYDHMGDCNPQGTYINGRKAFDYYYKYRDYASNREIFDLFVQEYDTHGKEVPAFVVNPFVALLVEMYDQKELDLEEARKYSMLVLNAIQHQSANCEGEACQGWEIVQSYSPAVLQKFESQKGFYDCNYFKDKYWEEWLADSMDCDVSRRMMARLKHAGCDDTDRYVTRVDNILKTKCRTTNDELRDAYDALKEGDYKGAIEAFELVIQQSDDMEKKAKYSLKIAQIHYTYLKDYPAARRYALQAGEYQPEWGEPYMLIGNLYASSGPLCGSGRGFESQRVVWVAIDQWNYAKKIDPSVAQEANKNIANYQQYMPTIEDVFQRGLKEGESYLVPCWIQKSTTIRAARN